MWRNIRIAILLLILVFVALNTWFDRVYSTDWNNSLHVAILPVNADGSAAAERYIQSLGESAFQPIDSFFAEEAPEYGVALEQPVRMVLGPRVNELPPMLETAQLKSFCPDEITIAHVITNIDKCHYS